MWPLEAVLSKVFVFFGLSLGSTMIGVVGFSDTAGIATAAGIATGSEGVFILGTTVSGND